MGTEVSVPQLLHANEAAEHVGQGLDGGIGVDVQTCCAARGRRNGGGGWDFRQDEGRGHCVGGHHLGDVLHVLTSQRPEEGGCSCRRCC